MSIVGMDRTSGMIKRVIQKESVNPSRNGAKSVLLCFVLEFWAETGTLV